MSHSNSAQPRKYLSVDALIEGLRERFEAIPDPRRAASTDHSLADCLMSAFAMFSLKDPSLLAFEHRRHDQSLMNLYRIKSIPSDTQQREVLDQIDPKHLNECFADIFYELQRSGVLKEFAFQDGRYLLAIDGTGYFSSTSIRCPHCLIKNKKKGKTEYAHQLVAAVIVHPDRKEVIPIAVEPIVQQDGDNKNDCERNAVRRLLKTIREMHPKLDCIVTEDGLSSNGPHIQDLIKLKFHYLLGAKPGDHEFLFDNFIRMNDLGMVQSVSEPADGSSPATETQWHDHLQLNASHPELEVKFIQHMEFDTDLAVKQRFSWVTDLVVAPENVRKLVRGGRARWKIENETFNTLKNQGYHLEHNYGHGQKHLSTVFAAMTMLAFLVDQVQQASCPLFAKAMAKFNTRRAYWDHLRACFEAFELITWIGLYQAIIDGMTRGQPLRHFNTS
jgi:hypothetical protein